MKKMDGPVALAAEQNGVPTNSSAEVPQIRVPDLERIRNARRGRMLQLKEWQQYDRKMTRESEKLQRKGLAQSTERNYFAPGRTVKFPQSLIFLEAAARGDLDEVRKLLSNGVCPDVANEDGLTALHQCCIDNVPEMCRLLLRFGANPNARDTEKWTPLHAAATCEHTELCGILIAHGADLLAMNADGNMPYECCQPGPTLSLIETEMDKRGITQEELDDLHRLPECQMLADMETLYKAGKDLNGLDSQGASLLHIAAACGYEEVTIFLLKHGAKIDLLDRDGWQAIHIAACWGHLEVIERLVNFGADIMAKTTSGESVFDICEDEEMHARLTEIKEEMERKQFQSQSPQNRSGKQRELVRRRSSNNPRTASIRRSSMREKKMMSWKEAKQEAEMRGVTTANLGNADEWSGGQDATKLNNTAPTKTETYPPSPALPKIRSPPRINSPASSDSAYSPPLTSPDQSGLSSNFGTSPSPDYNNSSRPDRLHPLPPLNTHGHTRQPNGATSPPNPRPTTNRQADKNFPKSARSDRFPMSSGDSASSAFIRNRESDQKPSAKILSHPSSHYGQEMNHISIPHSRAVQRPGDPLNVTELSPSPKPRATGNDRNSPFTNRRKQTGGIITSASPQPSRKTESVKRRPQEEKPEDLEPPSGSPTPLGSEQALRYSEFFARRPSDTPEARQEVPTTSKPKGPFGFQPYFPAPYTPAKQVSNSDDEESLRTIISDENTATFTPPIKIFDAEDSSLDTLTPKYKHNGANATRPDSGPIASPSSDQQPSEILTIRIVTEPGANKPTDSSPASTRPESLLARNEYSPVNIIVPPNSAQTNDTHRQPLVRRDAELSSPVFERGFERSSALEGSPGSIRRIHPSEHDDDSLNDYRPRIMLVDRVPSPKAASPERYTDFPVVPPRTIRITSTDRHGIISTSRNSPQYPKGRESTLSPSSEDRHTVDDSLQVPLSRSESRRRSSRRVKAKQVDTGTITPSLPRKSVLDGGASTRGSSRLRRSQSLRPKAKARRNLSRRSRSFEELDSDRPPPGIGATIFQLDSQSSRRPQPTTPARPTDAQERTALTPSDTSFMRRSQRRRQSARPQNPRPSQPAGTGGSPSNVPPTFGYNAYSSQPIRGPQGSSSTLASTYPARNLPKSENSIQPLISLTPSLSQDVGDNSQRTQEYHARHEHRRRRKKADKGTRDRNNACCCS